MNAPAATKLSRLTQGDICELGRVLMQGSFSVWISHKRGATRMKELARFKPMQRHFFLYEKALLLCKRRDEHSDSSVRTASYSFKHCLKVSLWNAGGGNNCYLHIWHKNSGSRYLFSCWLYREKSQTWLRLNCRVICIFWSTKRLPERKHIFMLRIKKLFELYPFKPKYELPRNTLCALVFADTKPSHSILNNFWTFFFIWVVSTPKDRETNKTRH